MEHEDDPILANVPDERLAGPDDETVQRSPGIESQLVLARARARLLPETMQGAPVTVGRYRITRRLGAGAMGLVWAGRDEQLDREVAIKLLKSQLASSETSRQRLIREAQAMARLSHPNVAHVYEVGEHEEQLFIAMELVRGETLRSWDRARERSVPEILGIHLQAARGLAAAHAVGLVHRDYKPDNVMISDEGPTGERVRVMDFGLARSRDEAWPSGEHAAVSEASNEALSRSPLLYDVTETGTVMGTPAYMAPEQMAGRRVDARADQFAFCVALYESLHGERPFRGATATELSSAIQHHELRRTGGTRHKLPRALEVLLRRGLAFAPADRFPDMQALIDVLEPHARAASRSRTAAVVLALAGAASLAWVLVAQRDDASSVASEPVDAWAEIVAGSQLPGTLAEPLTDDPAHVTIHRLRNGLTVYLAPRPGVPSVDTVVVVRADATDEAPEQAGVANLLRSQPGDSDRTGTSDVEAEAPILAREYAALAALEPGLDDATRNAKIAEAIAAQNERWRYEIPGEAGFIAGELGLGTQSLERPPGTVLAQAVPRHRLAAWATLTAERLRRPSFRNFLGMLQWEVEYHRESAQDALRVELDRRIGDAAGWSIDDVTGARALSEIPFSPMLRFLRDYYHPNNTAIVLVGDVSATEALPILEQAFGDWEPAPLPEQRRPDPLPKGTATTKVIDDGPARVVIAWPRDHADSRPVEVLERLLLRSSLAARWLEADGRARWIADDPEPYSFEITVAPLHEHTLAEAEAAARELLGALARGEIDDAELRTAQAQAQLQSLSSMSSPYALSLEIAESFATRVQWQDHVAALRGDALGREAIMSAARALLDRGGLVVQREQGPSATVDLRPLDLDGPLPEGPPASGPSLFAAALLDAPASRLEPQFLVPGRDLVVQPWGQGRAIAVDEDVPVYSIRFIVPFGVADDPWTCDAWRARVRALQPMSEPLGMQMIALCGPRSTAVDVVAVAARIDEQWPVVLSLPDAELADVDAERQLEATRAGRLHLRTDESARRESFAIVALRGEQGVDASMPDDAALARGNGATLRGALTRSLAVAPELLIAGPDARGLLARLPPPGPGAGRLPELLRARELAATTVFVMHDPTRTRADVRLGATVVADDPRSLIAIEVLRALPDVEIDAPVRETITRFAMPRDDTLDGRQVLTMQGAECAHEDVPMMLDTLLAFVRTPPSSDGLARARGYVETELRVHRRVGLEAALDAWSWAAIGRTTDPSVEEWIALGGLDDAALSSFHARVAATPLVLTVLADMDRIDRADLARFGELVEIELEALRDPELSDRGLFGYDPGPP